MSNGKRIISNFTNGVNAIDPGIMKTAQALATTAQLEIYNLNAHVMACNCECLGMNADNCIAAIENEQPPFTNKDYTTVMLKWGVIDEEGNPLI